ncbi:MAG: glycosyltransferase family 2 protein [Ferruginibacter sp.]
MLSIIIPVYNEAKNISVMADALKSIVHHPFEIIFVDDGSTDETLQQVRLLANDNDNIKCISLSRNFGHQNALMAGMEFARGNEIITMDGDMQHPPSLIPEMLKLLHEGYDIVFTRRRNNENQSGFKKATANLFYRFLNVISDTKIEPNVADFKAFNHKVLSAILRFKERELFIRGIFSWIGFKSITIGFDVQPRHSGKTKYNFGSMMRLALKGTTSFGFKPLRLALMIGSLISLLAFGFAFFALIQYYNGNTVPGWASLIIAVMFLGGVQLLAIGLLGEYIASLFIEVKKRPLYLVKDLLNLDDENRK